MIDRNNKQDENRRRRHAIITIDVDCTHGHIQTIEGGRRINRKKNDRFISISYNKWLARFLNILERRGVRATFFLVADFAAAPSSAEILRRIAAGGHEIASHTTNHRLDLCAAGTEIIRSETAGSRKILEDACGHRVEGFRGPAYAVNSRILGALLENGYTYDSSVVPGFLFSAYKRLVWIHGRLFSGGALMYPNKPPRVSKHPYYIIEENDNRLLEIPINVLPILPVPFVSFLMWNRKRADFMYNLVKKTADPLVYQFHDFEFMDFHSEEESLLTTATANLAKTRLADRLALYDMIVGRISEEYTVITAGEFARSFGER